MTCMHGEEGLLGDRDLQYMIKGPDTSSFKSKVIVCCKMATHD